MKNLKLFITLFICSISLEMVAQPALETSGIPQTIPGAPASYTQMVQQLFGSGVVITNLVINCDTTAKQMGWFVSTGSNLGLNSGLLLTSGSINNPAPGVGGPPPTGLGANNTGGYTGTLTPSPGDATLDNIPGVLGTNDACGIEFDIIPYCDTIAIKYVFGSEEYMEFVGSFNDVFGFFITGPNPTGGNYASYNIARLPGTTTPVSINNVNCGANPTYYVCNEPFSTGCGAGAGCPASANTTSVQYDGMTVVLTAEAAVVPCQSYHVKIVVADDLDNALDSGVFLEAGGVQCSSGLINVGVGNSIGVGGNIAVEGCVDGLFTFSIPVAQAVNDTFNFTVGGTATPNIDYLGTMPTQIVVTAGQTTVTVPVTIIQDGITEPIENILLIYTDSTLCGSQVIQDTFILEIVDAPVTNAGPDIIICSGDTATIGGPCSAGYTYSWSPTAGIGGITDTVTTLTLINSTSAPITYQYILTADALLGVCGSADTTSVTVNPSVTAGFVTNNVCYGLPATFTNTSSPSAVSWLWTFGDNTSSTLQSPTHLYAAAGNYTVMLVSFPVAGCSDTSIQQITIYPTPIADFTAPAVCFPLPSIFTDNTTAAVPTVWEWSFGDLSTSLIQSPTHNYAMANTYNAQLITITADGCRDTVTKPVVVNPQVFADFNAPNVCYGVNAVMTNMSNAPATIFSWDFGDNTSSTLANPTHFYASENTYNITLYSESPQGCKDTITKPIVIYGKPIAEFTAPPVCFGATTSFTDNTSNGTIVNWNWNFGDNQNGNVQNPTHTYTSDGTYQGQLIVTTNEGCKDTVVHPVQVYKLPIADFNFVDGCLSAPLLFTFSGLAGSAPITTYGWDFGDTQFGNGDTVSHSYVQPNTYTVSLSVIDGNGCTDSETKTVTAYPMPTAAFSLNNACQDASVSFVNSSSVSAGSITQSLWEFGDGATSLDNAPSHTYTNAGIFPVTLTVTTDNGCVHTTVQTITIYPRPTTDFNLNTVCVGDTTVFQDLTTITPIVADDYLTSWSWDFGDGNTNTVNQNPTHLYATPGTYAVKLTTTTDKGCTRTLTKAAHSYPLAPPPVVVEDTVCSGEAIALFANLPQGVRAEWYHSPTDPSPFFVGNPYQLTTFLFNEVFFVQAVNNIGGCRSDFTPIRGFVYPSYTLQLGNNPAVVETPNAITTFNLASPVPIVSYQWDFGDGETSSAPSPTHEYQHPRIYNVTVKTVDVNGCKNESKMTVEVKQVFDIFVPSAFSPNDDLSNDYFTVGVNNMQSFYIEVFSRWGGVVYSSSSMDFKWNGKDKDGKDLPEGVYVYKVKGISTQNKPVEKTGTVTLMR